jgi:hypothetical protein
MSGSYHPYVQGEPPVMKKPAYGRMPLPLWFLKPVALVANLVVLFALVSVVFPAKPKAPAYAVTTPKAR